MEERPGMIMIRVVMKQIISSILGALELCILNIPLVHLLDLEQWQCQSKVEAVLKYSSIPDWEDHYSPQAYLLLYLAGQLINCAGHKHQL